MSEKALWDAVNTFKQTTGRWPKRVVMAPDVHRAAMDEARRRIREEPWPTSLDEMTVAEVKQMVEEASRPGLRILTTRQVSPGTLYCDDGEGDTL